MKTETIEALRKLYKENEEANRHSNNYSLLAKGFGVDWQRSLADANLRYQFTHNESNFTLSNTCYELVHKPLIGKLFEPKNT